MTIDTRITELEAPFLIMDESDLLGFGAGVLADTDIELLYTPISFERRSEPPVLLCSGAIFTRAENQDFDQAYSRRWGERASPLPTHFFRAAPMPGQTQILNPTDSKVTPAAYPDSTTSFRLLLPLLGLVSFSFLGMAQLLSSTILIHSMILVPLALALAGFSLVAVLPRQAILPATQIPRSPIKNSSLFALGLIMCGLLGIAQATSGFLIIHPIILVPLSIILLGFSFVVTLRTADNSE